VLLEEGTVACRSTTATSTTSSATWSRAIVLSLAWEKGLVVLEDILRPAHKVPESTRALDLAARDAAPADPDGDRDRRSRRALRPRDQPRI